MKKNNPVKNLIVFFLTAFQLFGFHSPLWAESVLNAKIQAITFLNDGRVEVKVKSRQGETSFIVSDSTVIETVIPVSQVKSGQRISVPSQARSGKRGFHAPFSGMSNSMKKRMGLPNIASTPDIPGVPESAVNVPKVPKVPKVAVKSGGGEAAPEAAGSQKQGRKELPTGEPSEEEKSLYGRMESGKSLVGKSGTPVESKKVVRTQSTKNGIKLELETDAGKKEEMVLSPTRQVVQKLSIKDLHKNMAVDLEAAKNQDQYLADKITVIA